MRFTLAELEAHKDISHLPIVDVLVSVYPELVVQYSKPMLWANEGQYYDEVRLQEQEPHYLMVPSGHFRKDAKTRALSVRTLINGVEFRTGSPIFLLETRIWASDSGTMTYQCLLGAQEDELRNPEDGETFWGGEAEAFFIRKVPLGACPNIPVSYTHLTLPTICSV